MIRNLKALGLSLVAVFAMSALGASSASAVDVVTTGVSPALLTGVGHNHVFSAHDGTPKFECTTSKFAATVKNGDSEITADVSYNGTVSFNGDPETQTKTSTTHCNASSGTATIDMNGCGYILTGDTSGNAPAGHTAGKDATVWIHCPIGKNIQVTSSLGVTLTIPPQTPTTGGVSYTNVPVHDKNTAVAVKATVTGITSTCGTSTFICTLGGIPHHSNQYTYTGDVTMTAFEDIEGLPTPVTEGPRTSLSSS